MKAPEVLKKLGRVLLKILAAFLILEPIWMLLPFAGFLYGSVLNIQSLSANPSTAWLTHFVFPVMTIGLFGPLLSLIGLLLFFVGAAQIYTAKFRKTGLVRTGLYRIVRHPQYIALTFFSLGILLTWGRAIAFVAAFAMMLLYYHLTKLEERKCIALFGEEYELYRARTSFIIPGDRHLRGISARLWDVGVPAWLRFVGTVVLAAALCVGSMGLIRAVKKATLVVPYLDTELELADQPARPDVDLQAGTAGGLPYVTDGRIVAIRGPYRAAAAPGFAERVVLRLRDSARLAPFLAFLEKPGADVAVVFGLPFDRKAGNPGAREQQNRGPAPDPFGTDRATLFLFRMSRVAGASVEAAVADPAKRRIQGACQAQVDLGRPKGEEIVAGEFIRPGPRFPGEDRFAFVTRQVLEQMTEGGAAADVPMVPGANASTRLVLVKAPIYRTRRDPAFAQEILDRLKASPRLAEHLRKLGVGGEVVPLVFPRPGENWYREHHGTPKLTLFVMLVRSDDGDSSIDALFDRERRSILGAFTASMDFAVDSTEDSISDFASIGLRRDLEERFAFFLSGL